MSRTKGGFNSEAHLSLDAHDMPVRAFITNGMLNTQINNQTFIINVFFDHYSKETFQDKLLRVILADLPMAANQ